MDLCRRIFCFFLLFFFVLISFFSIHACILYLFFTLFWLQFMYHTNFNSSILLWNVLKIFKDIPIQGYTNSRIYQNFRLKTCWNAEIFVKSHPKTIQNSLQSKIEKHKFWISYFVSIFIRKSVIKNTKTKVNVK